MTFLPFLLNRSKLPICSYYFFLFWPRSEEHTSELQSHLNLVCRLLLEKKKRSTVAARTSTDCVSATTHCRCILASRHACIRPDSAALEQQGLQRQREHPVFFNDPAPTEIYPLPLHDALPI